MTENNKAPEDERTREAEAMIWEALSRREWRPTILDNLHTKGMSYAEARTLVAKVEAEWRRIREEDRIRRGIIIAAIGGFVIPFVTTLMEVVIKLETNLYQEVSDSLPGFGPLPEFIADKIAGISGIIIGALYTFFIEDYIDVPGAQRAASYV